MQNISNAALTAIENRKVPLEILKMHYNEILMRCAPRFYFTFIQTSLISQEDLFYFLKNYCKALSYAQIVTKEDYDNRDPYYRVVIDDWNQYVHYVGFDPDKDLSALSQHGYVSHEYHHMGASCRRYDFYDLSLLERVFDDSGRMKRFFLDNRYRMISSRKNVRNILTTARSNYPIAEPRDYKVIPQCENLLDNNAISERHYLLYYNWGRQYIASGLNIVYGDVSGEWIVDKDGARKSRYAKASLLNGELDLTLEVCVVGQHRRLKGVYLGREHLFITKSGVFDLLKLDIKKIVCTDRTLPLDALVSEIFG